MTASPLALLRGAAPLFYELLADAPAARRRAARRGLARGRLPPRELRRLPHRRALGRRRRAASHAAEKVVFDLNDFDDAFVGPWRFDVAAPDDEPDPGRTRDRPRRDAHARARATRCSRRTSAPRSTGRRCRLPRLRDGARREGARAHAQGSSSTRARDVVGGGTALRARAALRGACRPKLRAKAERAFAKYVKRLPEAERPAARSGRGDRRRGLPRRGHRQPRLPARRAPRARQGRGRRRAGSST